MHNFIDWMTGLLNFSAETYARAIDDADIADWGGPTRPTSPPLAGRKGTGAAVLASVVVVVTVLVKQRIYGRSVRATARTHGCAETEVNAVIDRFADATIDEKTRKHSLALELARLDQLQEPFCTPYKIAWSSRPGYSMVDVNDLCARGLDRRKRMLGAT